MKNGNDSSVGPTFMLEEEMASRAGRPVAGVDEAGRGPWAGPVVAAAVILDVQNFPDGLDDSKKLTEAARDRLYDEILRSSKTGVGIAGVERIDLDNILSATMWAMAEAVKQLPAKPGAVLIDGNRCPNLPCPGRAIVKGDQKSLSIAAASIIAKVTRDRLMTKLGADFPGYGFERHKGYGTKVHKEALLKFGVTSHHRRSFKPIRSLLERT